MMHLEMLLNEISSSQVDTEGGECQNSRIRSKIEELLKFQNGTAPERLKMMNAIGTLAQKEFNRQHLIRAGSTLIAAQFVTDHTSEEEIIQAIRAIANLCFDNQEARSIVLNSGITEPIVSMMETAKPPLLKVIAGYLTNLSSDCAETSHQIVKFDGHRFLINCLDSKENSIVILLIKAIGNLSVFDSIALEMVELGLLEKILSIIENLDEEMLYECFNVLLNIFSESKPAFERFVRLNGPNVLISILKTHNFSGTEECQKTLRSYWDLLTSLVDSEKLSQLIDQTSIIDSMIEFFLDTTNVNIGVCQGAGEFLSKVSEQGLFLTRLASHIPEYLQILTSNCDCRVRVSSAIILSNLACDSKICTMLFEHNTHKVFISALSQKVTYKETQSIIDAAVNMESRCFDMELKGVIASGLRNMSVSGVYRQLLVDHGLIGIMLEFFSSEYDIAIHRLLISLKLLLLLGDVALKMLFNENFVNLLALTNSQEEFKRKDHIFYESSRVFYVIISNSSTEMLASILERYELQIVPIMCNLISSKFEILNFEGAFGLKRMLSVTKDLKRLLQAIYICPNLVTQILKIIRQSTNTTKASSEHSSVRALLSELALTIFLNTKFTEEEIQENWLPITTIEPAADEKCKAHLDKLSKCIYEKIRSTN